MISLFVTDCLQNVTVFGSYLGECLVIEEDGENLVEVALTSLFKDEDFIKLSFFTFSIILLVETRRYVSYLCTG